MVKTRFKKGQTVYYGRGNSMQELVIDKVYKNPLIPIHQYTFVGHNWACGEQSLRDTPDGRDLTLGECFVDDNELEFRINTLASASKRVLNESESELDVPRLKMWDNVRVEFLPSLDMCKWFKEYADGRFIVHVDSGQGHFVHMLKMSRARVIGIEKFFNKEKWIEWRLNRYPQDLDPNEIMEGTLEDHSRLLNNFGNNCILVFTRPKDNKNLNYAISNLYGKCEILLVDKEANFDTEIWKRIPHRGTSEDNEVVYSLKKET